MQEDLIYDAGIWIPSGSSGGCKMCDRQTLSSYKIQNSQPLLTALASLSKQEI